jgi:hypothetical protein
VSPNQNSKLLLSNRRTFESVDPLNDKQATSTTAAFGDRPPDKARLAGAV